MVHHSTARIFVKAPCPACWFGSMLLYADGDVMELQEFYEHMEQHRAAVVESAVQRYRSLTPLLGKVCTPAAHALVVPLTTVCTAALYGQPTLYGRVCRAVYGCIPTEHPPGFLVLPAMHYAIAMFCCNTLQVEELVAGSNTGKSPQLAGYYSYWEMAVFNGLVLMVLRALEKLHNTLGGSAKKPLFKVGPTREG